MTASPRGVPTAAVLAVCGSAPTEQAAPDDEFSLLHCKPPPPSDFTYMFTCLGTSVEVDKGSDNHCPQSGMNEGSQEKNAAVNVFVEQPSVSERVCVPHIRCKYEPHSHSLTVSFVVVI